MLNNSIVRIKLMRGNNELFFIYMRKGLNSVQRFIVKRLKNLKNKSCHNKKIVER